MSEDAAGLLPGRWTPTGAPPHEPQRPRRRRRGAVVGAVAAVLALGVAGALALGLLDRAPGSGPAPEPVVLPSPTPTVVPIAREPRTPFADALPATVLQYALASVEEETSLLVAGALEGYRLGYADGADGVLTVLAGQWPTADPAATVLAATTSDATPVDDGGRTSGDVLADGITAGTWALTRDRDGATWMTWTNGTALFRATGPADVLRDVLAAYPL